MKIAIIGTHGIGKTTLSYLLAAESKKRGKNARVVNEVARSSPFPLNEGFSVDGAHWIITTQIHKELNAKAAKTELIICDRSSIDPIMYLHVGNFDKSEYHFLALYAKEWLRTYDQIIFVSPSQNDIQNDGVRSVDKEFRKIVHQNFVFFIETLPMKCTHLNSDSIFNNDLDTIYKRIL